jgi:hypothetical protein
MVLLCVYVCQVCNPASVFELPLLMGTIEEPAVMPLDVQLYVLF